MTFQALELHNYYQSSGEGGGGLPLKLSSLPMLSIYFVNPNSSTEKKWIIYPFTHSKITEHSALKLGLMTLFESVEEYK